MASTIIPEKTMALTTLPDIKIKDFATALEKLYDSKNLTHALLCHRALLREICSMIPKSFKVNYNMENNDKQDDGLHSM